MDYDLEDYIAQSAREILDAYDLGTIEDTYDEQPTAEIEFD